MPTPDRKAVVRTIRTFLTPGQVTEVRSWWVKNGFRTTYSGYFDYDHAEDLADAVTTPQLGEADGVYFMPNPVQPSLHSRAYNRLRKLGKEDNRATTDSDIVEYRWLLIDLDTRRPAGVSATPSEHQAALRRAKAVATDLTKRFGWPEAIVGDSGNGAHLLYQVSLDVSERGLVQRVLDGLDYLYGDDEVYVDQTTHNPARIWKLYGTPVRKGDDTPERPHRLARLLHVPAKVQPLDRVYLLVVADQVPKPDVQGVNARDAGFDLEPWVAKHLPEGVVTRKDYTNGKRWVFDVCPMNPDHSDRSAWLIQFHSGAVSAGCQHNGCKGPGRWGWRELREKFEGPRVAAAADPSPLWTENPKRVGPRYAMPFKPISEYELRSTEWAWEPYFPLGKLVSFDGDPGLGKTFALVDILSRISSGQALPDGQPNPFGREGAPVYFMTAEDDIYDTIGPRVLAAGGDLKRFFVTEMVEDLWEGMAVPVTFPRDLSLLEQNIKDTGAKLVVIDPVMSFLDEGADTSSDHSVRRVATGPLRALALRTGACVVFVRHLRKAQAEQLMYRAMGSVGFSGTARVAHAVVPHPDDDGTTRRRRVLTPYKSNSGPLPPALEFEILSQGPVARVQWLGTSEYDLTTLQSSDPSGKQQDLADAMEYLREEWLANGPRASREIEALAREHKFSRRVLSEAAKRLNVQKERIGNLRDGGYWAWSLPEEEPAADDFLDTMKAAR